MNTYLYGRKFDKSVTSDVKNLLAVLANKDTGTSAYKDAMFKIGQFMGEELSKKLDSSKSYCVASTVEDADFLSKGIIDVLSSKVKFVYLVCFWNDRLSINGHSVAPIYN